VVAAPSWEPIPSYPSTSYGKTTSAIADPSTPISQTTRSSPALKGNYPLIKPKTSQNQQKQKLRISKFMNYKKN
jgi:hypothetical protein